MLDNKLIEVKRHDGIGYQPLVTYEAWRVAVLRFADDLKPGNLKQMERHTKTDEVFVLTHGHAMLILGGNDQGVGELSTSTMRPGEIHNVKKGTWHTIAISQDANILIVENDDTGPENSQYCPLNGQNYTRVQKLALEFLAGYF